MENQDFSKTITNNPSADPGLLLRRLDGNKSIRDIFLEDGDYEDAEVFYPSKMNYNASSNLEDKEVEQIKTVQPFLLENTETLHTNDLASKKVSESKPFIVANTSEVGLNHLRNDCIIPVFSKDNEKTIAHQEFIDVVYDSVSKLFPYQTIAEPEIRVSHQIKGRTPDAIHLNARDLEDHQKTIYYERMAFLIKIPSITSIVNGNELSLCVGGVRSYNQENLYSKKTLEKFKFFIGYQNWVCMNMCISTDGFKEDLRVSNANELQTKVLGVMQDYNAEMHGSISLTV